MGPLLQHAAWIVSLPSNCSTPAAGSAKGTCGTDRTGRCLRCHSRQSSKVKGTDDSKKTGTEILS